MDSETVIFNNNNVRLLQKRLSNEPRRMRNNVLHAAVRSRDYQKIAELIEQGADVNSHDCFSNGVIHNAVESGDPRILRLLIESGANVNRPGNNKCESVLELAVSRGKVEIVRILLDHGADVHAGGTYPLTKAIDTKNFEGDREEMVKLLLDCGANVNGIEEGKLTPLCEAACEGHVEIVELLLDRGAKCDQYPMMHALYCKRTRVVKLLLDRGFSVHQDDECLTGLACSILLQDKKTVRLLLDYGIPVNAARSTDGKCAIHYAAGSSDVEILQLLLEHGADINAVYDGKTALALALGQGRVGISKVLVKHIVLMKSQNLLIVSEDNLSALEASDELKVFKNECHSEIEVLRKRKFKDSSLCYLDVVQTKDIDRIAAWARNQNIVRVLKSLSFKIRFPIYGEMIVQHFNKGISKNEDFQLIRRFFNYLSTRETDDKLSELPLISVCEIFTHLNDKDVAQLRHL